MSDFRLVDKKGLKTIYGIPYCSQHIARLEKAGKFPRRIQLGALQSGVVLLGGRSLDRLAGQTLTTTATPPEKERPRSSYRGFCFARHVQR